MSYFPLWKRDPRWTPVCPPSSALGPAVILKNFGSSSCAVAVELAKPLPDLVHGARILERRRVPDLLPGDEGTDHASHDLPAAGLRKFLRDVHVVRDRDGPDRVADVLLEVPLQRLGPPLSRLQNDVRDEGLPLHRMRLPDDGGLRDLRMA